MSGELARAARLLLCASALSSVACGGAATVAPTSPSGSARAPGSKLATSGGLELVVGAPKLKVAGAVADTDGLDAPEIQILASAGRGQGRERSTMEPQGFKVSDLPLLEIPEPLAASAAPKSPPDGEDAAELFVDWQSALRGSSIIARPETYTSVRVSLRGQRLARIRVGGSEGTVAGGGGGGIYVVCRVPEDAPKRFVSARWESLASSMVSGTLAPSSGGATASPDAPATLTITDAWFDMRECKATIVRRTSIQVKALAGGLLFAYRERCVKCAPGASTELVTLLSPMPAQASASGIGGDATTALGAVSRVTLPIRKGGGGSFIARYTAGITRDWLGALSRRGAPDGDVVVGVDIAQGVGDPEPVALAYASPLESSSPDPAAPPSNGSRSAGDVFGSVGAPKKIAPKKPNNRGGLVDPFARRDQLGF